MARPIRQLTPEQKTDMVRRYTKLGQTLNIIALAHDVGPKVVRAALLAAGVQLRAGGLLYKRWTPMRRSQLRAIP